ncbi:MAG: ArsR family transcriptional regulator [Alphaproteobacteria bacterium RIFCSPHIGHO2_12_FULL_63_12]|nr:MAG: ArsR family transcriptional regulator [Alphaproteobacteria bacterium RIFCSPHIGHO2_12_FULL_63_12]
MTEITETPVTLTPAIQRFVLHWGDMGQTWGVNRSVAQIHALLFVAGRPMSAEEIAELLKMARSNVSTSIRDLTNWGLVRRAPVLGDRRDFFEAESDVWEMTSKIVAIRKAREIDPVTDDLKSFLDDAARDPETSAIAVTRLSELKAMIDLLNNWYDQMNRVPKSQLLPLIKLGSKAVELLGPFLKKTPHPKP